MEGTSYNYCRTRCSSWNILCQLLINAGHYWFFKNPVMHVLHALVTHVFASSLISGFKISKVQLSIRLWVWTSQRKKMLCFIMFLFWYSNTMPCYYTSSMSTKNYVNIFFLLVICWFDVIKQSIFLLCPHVHILIKLTNPCYSH